MRAVLEVAAIRHVAERLNEFAIARLRQALRDERAATTLRSRRTGGERFHLLIAELSGNPVLRLALGMLLDLGAQSDRTSSPCDGHAAILDAAIGGDAALAQHRMREHLHEVGRLAA